MTHIVIPFNGGLNSLASFIWAVRHNYKPVLVYVTNLFPHSNFIELKSVNQFVDNLFDGWNGSHMMLWKPTNFQSKKSLTTDFSSQPSSSSSSSLSSSSSSSTSTPTLTPTPTNSPPQKQLQRALFIYRLNNMDLLRIESHPDPDHYRKAILLQKLAITAKSIHTNYIVWPFPNTGIEAFSSDQSVNFVLKFPYFKGSTFNLVSSWIDETREYQEQKLKISFEEEEEIGEHLEDEINYAGYFPAYFDPWNSVKVCRHTSRRLNEIREQTGCQLSGVCGECLRCREFLIKYYTRYGNDLGVDNITLECKKIEEMNKMLAQKNVFLRIL